MATSPTPGCSEFVDADTLRTQFAFSMSAMYRAEVPLYSDLVNMVRDINEVTLQQRDGENLTTSAALRTNIDRLTLERHCAIRLGTPYEIRTVKRIFIILGMHPVGYYDLSVAGLPMHATCFRPKEVSSLDRNPFRVFTTLLRPELIESEKARQLCLALLGERKIFSDSLLEMLGIAEAQGGKLTQEQAEVFISEALLTFSWRPIAEATFSQYNILKAENPILADIACFQSAHINHLTPRTLDISAAQSAMRAAGMAVKSRIEGPPPRQCPILLRQTSFLALEEAVRFISDENISDAPSSLLPQRSLIEASHKARFGEIEERGAAVTVKGRKLYDKLLGEGLAKAAGASPEDADSIVAETFRSYPDNWAELRKQGLIYVKFECTKKQASSPTKRSDGESLIERLITDGIVEASPITYEDFLPLSAAGIFQSNLQRADGGSATIDLKQPSADLKGLEKAIQGKLLDADEWYAHIQLQSLEAVARGLSLAKEQLLV
ncbi:hypothetical protein VE00_01028 [Pseudogymnoascus sp. WSF 3629]|nr:hypothetical protein VE00_01028 [Pseudogymnoascus sp. WSF 3629]